MRGLKAGTGSKSPWFRSKGGDGSQLIFGNPTQSRTLTYARPSHPSLPGRLLLCPSPTRTHCLTALFILGCCQRYVAYRLRHGYLPVWELTVILEAVDQAVRSRDQVRKLLGLLGRHIQDLHA